MSGQHGGGNEVKSHWSYAASLIGRPAQPGRVVANKPHQVFYRSVEAEGGARCEECPND